MNIKKLLLVSLSSIAIVAFIISKSPESSITGGVISRASESPINIIAILILIGIFTLFLGGYDWLSKR
ncbi:MAG: hypothetical protein KJ601_05790 [Nanoarchaeota archaeon]|nr:hypothetical protein [Nanoarchaeota archaeon]